MITICLVTEADIIHSLPSSHPSMPSLPASRRLCYFALSSFYVILTSTPSLFQLLFCLIRALKGSKLTESIRVSLKTPAPSSGSGLRELHGWDRAHVRGASP